LNEQRSFPVTAALQKLYQSSWCKLITNDRTLPAAYQGRHFFPGNKGLLAVKPLPSINRIPDNFSRKFRELGCQATSRGQTPK
jgi:hypothetical protein